MQKTLYRAAFVGAAVLMSAAWLASAQSIDDIEPAGHLPEQPLDAAPLAQMSARLGYNSEYGGVVGASVRSDRVFGSHSLRFSVEASADRMRYNLNYGVPQLFGDNPSFGLGAYSSRTQANSNLSFDSVVHGIEPRLTWQISPGQTIATYAAFTSGEIAGVDPATSVLIRNDVGNRAGQAVGIKYDRVIRRPEGGLRRISYGLDAALGQTDRNHRYTQVSGRLNAGWVVGPKENVLLRARLSGSTINTTSGTSHIGDRLMLGSSTIRGFAFGGFGPRDLAVSSNPALGGNTFASARFDAQFAGFGGSDRLMPGVFLDVGSLWGLDDANGGLAGTDPVDDSLNLRASAGVSIVIQTGVGPVKMSYARPFQSEVYDQTQEFSLSFSQQF